MTQVIASPSRYIQGKGESGNLCKYAANFGKKLCILTSASGRKRVEDQIVSGQKDSGVEIQFEVFNGECCMTEISRISDMLKQSGCDMIAGVGGGKIHDTAKAAGYYTGLPVLIVPTIASTDAPCSALSVIYTDEGVFEKYLFLPSSPNVVLMPRKK